LLEVKRIVHFRFTCNNSLGETTPVERSTRLLATDVWVPLLVGATFLALACLKLYGLARGTVGGRDKPFKERLCGT
jgi:hypothetical protein